MDQYIGRQVAKKFPGHGPKKFKGTVVATGEVEGEQYWTIKYEDEDEEDVDLKELKRILVPLPKQQKRKTPEPPAATAGAGEQQPDQLAADEQQQPVEEQQPQPVEEAQGPSTAAGPSKRQVGGTDQQQAAVLSSSKGLTEQLRGVVDEVAAGSIALELNVRRYPDSQKPADAAQRSRVVACGNVCYTSALRPVAGRALPEEAPEDQVNAEYKSQAEEVLSQLEAVLREAGSGKEHLLSVTVLLKDLPAGRAGFAEAWNAWVPRGALPSLMMQESYLGREDWYVSASAVAAVPSRPYM